MERELGFNLISKENQRGHFSLDGLAEGHFQGGSGSGGTGWKKRILSCNRTRRGKLSLKFKVILGTGKGIFFCYCEAERDRGEAA